MNLKIYLSCVSLLIACLSLSGQQTKRDLKLNKDKNSIQFEPIICYKSEMLNHHYVPPKATFRSSNVQRLTFNANYTNGTPAFVMDLFENFLAPNLSNIFSSNIPVNVQIEWLPLEGNALAGARPNRYFFSPAFPLQDIAYPIALAEKILKIEINDPEQADIVININSQENWYTDFNNPAGVGNRLDLASTLLHELYHGLGFVDFSNVNDSDQGFLSILPYSHAMETGDGVKLTDIEDGSLEMGSALTGNNLFFRGRSFEGGALPRLYAPIVFDGGSSIAHLDAITYNNTSSQLMTPTSAPGEVERSSGIADDMMYDMGWNYTSIVYLPPAPVENLDDPFAIEATIVSDNDVDESSFTLHYFVGRLPDETTMPMVKGDDDIFRAEIPATGQAQLITYYLSVHDMDGRTYTNPGEAPGKVLWRYDFGIDDIAPVIDHEPVTAISTVGNSLHLVADVTDEFAGLEPVQVEFSINKQLQEPIDLVFEPLNEFTNPIYQATVELPGGSLQENDILEYRIVAVDKANASNRTTSPENGEPGTQFGELEFWDYVIVEGQRLGERNWFPFLNGYDCRANPVWLNTYLGGIPNNSQDSDSQGTPQLFRNRTIDMTANGNFSVGDEIFIRFRMFSDPFAVGWGWAIDNLKIQETTVAVEDYVDENNFTVFPNPIDGNELNVAIDLNKNAPNTLLTVSDIYSKGSSYLKAELAFS